MDPNTYIGERVAVAVTYRVRDDISICHPVKMRFRNKEIIFTELGLRHPSVKGKRMVHVFDMSDGSNDYRLEFDAEMLTWTLVSILRWDS
jgi:hypothetical protein